MALRLTTWLEEEPNKPNYLASKANGAGNNPMVGMTVAVAVAVEEASK